MGVIGKADDQADCSHAYKACAVHGLCEDWRYLQTWNTYLPHRISCFFYFISSLEL